MSTENSKGKDLSFPSIESDQGSQSGYVAAANTTDQVMPTKVQTGNYTGDQVIKGTLSIVDDKGVVRLIMGYKLNFF